MEHVQAHQSKAASDLYRALSTDQTGNVFLSPFSISTALSMTWGGAAGNTAKQMKDALALPEDAAALHGGYGKVLGMLQDPPHVTLGTANRLYVQNKYTILDSYTTLLKDQYLAELKRVDFADAAGTSKLINDEVETLTRGKIKDLIDQSALSAMVRVVLVNAVYFKAFWSTKFVRNRTRPQDFHMGSGQVVQVDMMHLAKESLRCASRHDMDCKALELQYEGGRFSMLFLLPNQVDGLPSLEDQLAKTPLPALWAELQFQDAVVSIPKFKIEASYDLVSHLRTLGMKDLFCLLSADLSKISGSKDLFISKVIHKTFIEVNEEGTEAAAATAAVMMFGCALTRTEPLQFVADHPFFFAVVDRASGLTLFAGRYAGPQ